MIKRLLICVWLTSSREDMRDKETYAYLDLNDSSKKYT
jgi:hypothetical protein